MISMHQKHTVARSSLKKNPHVKNLGSQLSSRGKTLSLGYLHQQELDNNFESAFVPPRDSLSFEFKHSSANSMLFCKILLDNSKLEFNNGTIHCQIEHMYVNRHNEDFASTEHVAWSALMPSLRQEQE